jgi:hypothetical protein
LSRLTSAKTSIPCSWKNNLRSNPMLHSYPDYPY